MSLNQNRTCQPWLSRNGHMARTAGSMGQGPPPGSVARQEAQDNTPATCRVCSTREDPAWGHAHCKGNDMAEAAQAVPTQPRCRCEWPGLVAHQPQKYRSPARCQACEAAPSAGVLSGYGPHPFARQVASDERTWHSWPLLPPIHCHQGSAQAKCRGTNPHILQWWVVGQNLLSSEQPRCRSHVAARHLWPYPGRYL